MFNIVYFFVPKDYWGYTIDEKQIYKLNPQSWTEISIADSHSIYESKNWLERMFVNFFVDNKEAVARLLWEIKDREEELTIIKKSYRFNPKHTTILIKNEDTLVTRLNEFDNKSFDDLFIYTQQREIKKITCITSGETLELFIKNEYVDDVESVTSNWAVKVDYFEYANGQQE